MNKSKLMMLKNSATLNPSPQSVRDTLFQSHDFFDPNDYLQIKYEMLRRTQLEGWSVSKSTSTFGISRPSFYKALDEYKQRGLAGLVPEKRGPKHAHKLTQAVMTFVQSLHQDNKVIQSKQIAESIREKFNISVHPRTIEKALATLEKKRSSRWRK